MTRRRQDMCSDCGVSEYDRQMLGRYYDNIRSRNKEVERQAARAAVAEAQMRLMKADHVDEMAWLQSKVSRQRDTIKRLEDRIRIKRLEDRIRIKRLEDRIRALGSLPYGEERSS